MGGVKPHLLVDVRNNLGAELRVTYAPSTRFYLDDESAGRPWVTRLPFPIWTVERVETFDWVGRNRLVTRYAYHHGFFDGLEREFRGFGMVEQWDTEEFREDTQFEDDAFANWTALSSTPPILTRTWFHTGAFIDATKVTRQYESEYWLEPALRGPPAATGLSAMRPVDTALPDDLTPFEMREAYRALKGQALRVEVFDADANGPIGNPYSVAENNFTVLRLQGFGSNLHASFFVHPRESIALHYERGAADPRVTHEATLETNAYGDVLRALSIEYPRRAGPSPEPTLDAATRDRLNYDQARLHMRGFERLDTNAIDDITLWPDVYRGPHAAGANIAEITGVAPKDKGFLAASLFAYEELDNPSPTAPGIWQTVWSGARDVPYEAIPGADVDGSGITAGAPTRRLLAKTRTRYRSNDLAVLLPIGQLQSPVGQQQSLAVPGESYRAALTPSHVAAVFGALAPDAILQEGGYVQLPGESEWWAPSGRAYLSRGDGDTPAQELAYALAHFFLPLRLVDPFGNVSRVVYDKNALLATSAEDAVGNVTACANDYRVLAPVLVTDPNGNQAAAAFDALGLVTATAVMGKTSETLGDLLSGFTTDLDDATIAGFFADPLAAAPALIGKATTRVVMDVDAYQRTRASAQPSPPAVAVISHETHVADLAAGASPQHQFAFAYNDGFGRVIQHKARAAPGPLVDGGPVVSPRWIGSGWTIFNNKGNPVRKYEPFFSGTNGFEFAAQTGVSTMLFYDPADRVVATLHPDDTWEKVVFDAWRQESWDGNDTVAIADPRNDADVGNYFQRVLGAGAFTSWFNLRIGGTYGATADEQAAQKDAAQKAAAHASTTTVAHFDSLGRTCLAVADNGGDARFPSRTAYDTESKPLAIFDALGRRTEEYCYRAPQTSSGSQYVAGMDMAGSALYHVNADAGARRSLSNVVGNPIRSWDARGHAFRMVYDAAHRPTQRFVNTNGAADILVDLSIYGEGQAAANLCGRLFRHYDMAGYLENSQYDFKGNLVAHARQLALAYRQAIDWTPLASLTIAAQLDAAAEAAGLIPTGDGGRDKFVGSTLYDALNRPIQSVSPHNATMKPNVQRPGYDAGAQLMSVDVWLQQAAAPTALLNPPSAERHAVTAIAYNARGQRVKIGFGNGVSTAYAYDPLTFRMTQLTTTRPTSFAADQRVVQALEYFYDPVGNVTRIRDNADTQNVIFFRNQRVEPSSDYTYDPLYRLIAATGREHLGQTCGALSLPSQDSDDDSLRLRLPQLGDGNAMATYAESYAYDALGNILSMGHQVGAGSWTRRYAYNEASQIVAGEIGNRLSSTSLPGDPTAGPFTATYAYDAHGNMARMPHLPAMAWNEDDRLRSTTRQVVNAGAPQTSYYVYDSGGQRVRKITDGQAAAGHAPARDAERIYLGGIEVYREFGVDGTTVTLERETLPIAAGDHPVALIETRTIGTDPAPAQQCRYQFGNHLGSAELELGDQGDIISYEEYFPFGATS